MRSSFLPILFSLFFFKIIPAPLDEEALFAPLERRTFERRRKPVAEVNLVFKSDPDVLYNIDDQAWLEQEHRVRHGLPVIRMEINVVADRRKLDGMIAERNSGFRHPFGTIAITIISLVGRRIREKAGIIGAKGNKARVHCGEKPAVVVEWNFCNEPRPERKVA